MYCVLSLTLQQKESLSDLEKVRIEQSFVFGIQSDVYRAVTSWTCETNPKTLSTEPYNKPSIRRTTPLCKLCLPGRPLCQVGLTSV